MANKAKRRGRPPGSKNKVTVGNGKSTAKMDAGQLGVYIDGLENLLARKVQEQRSLFEGKLAELQRYASKGRAATPLPRTGKRAKAKPKYQSKKKPNLKWSGRGMTPVWMREEMKGTKLKKADFLIK